MIKINKDFINEVSNDAKNSTRRRKNFNFHKEMSDVLQRMIHALEPDTYIQPHKHETPDKREVFIILKGKVAAVQYTGKGEIDDWIILDRSAENYGVEFPSRSWHSLICLEPSSVLYEIKDGPYDPADDKNFADWAPTEGDAECQEFNRTVLEKLNLH